MRATEEEQEFKVISEGNLGAFYRHVNWRLTNKSGVSPLYNGHGKLVTDNAAKANLLNDYFASVCTDDNGRMPSVYHCVDSACSLSDITFTVDNDEAAIKRLNCNLSSGSDKLPPLLFKKLCEATLAKHPNCNFGLFWPKCATHFAWQCFIYGKLY